MRIPIPAAYDRVMDRMAKILFPPPKPVIWKITQTDVALGAYVLAIGITLSLVFGSWLWLVATIASMVLCWMLMEWFL